MALHYTVLPKYLLAPEVAALLHYLPDWTQVLQSLMGHEKYGSTEVYTRVFTLDVAASQNVTFTLPVADALQLQRDNRWLSAK
ncbi:resolvase [Buttiauxella gaviniae ATCC 51604]|uniref:Resolvase n=1 Tax=Buttiauxella gaviniae ATCC 51604 TaxID=1354253 RepID=A0A1B7HIQ8_9ENTR|nr:resolvase [Buttiauxella gaviniae ATCC 51604]